MILGWIAVVLSLIVSCFWAWWGILENFHEGWYLQSLTGNLLLTLAYIGPALLCISVSLVSIRFPKIGSVIIILLGMLLIIWWISQHWPPTFITFVHAVTISALLLISLGFMFRFGSPEPKKAAYLISTALPIAIIIGFGFKPALRVMARVDDGIRESRVVEGNDVRLMWAPAGPGWPGKPANWQEAIEICPFLNDDGKSLNKHKQNIWRLPTVAETVQSLTRNGENAKGQWDQEAGTAKFKAQPDKESPLWNATSPIIYWWTATEKDVDKAYVVSYNGSVFTRPKTMRMGSMAFRAVREVPSD